MNTPCYVFDFDQFEKRANDIANALPGIPLTYSIKANPFLLNDLPEVIRHVEVCSPGELEICKELNVPGEKIIYSGVVKEQEDIHEALTYGVDIITCESLRHAALIQQENVKVKTILRLTSGNQFGMSIEDIEYIIENKDDFFNNLDVIGLHFYSGTQKNLKKIIRDIEKIEKALIYLKTKLEYEPSFIEYGPGLCVEYFKENNEELELKHLKEAAAIINKFAAKHPLGIEMGRFLAASCGTFFTKVMDAKSSMDTNYVLIDGGIHHVNYYGQKMAMEVPNINVISEGYRYSIEALCLNKNEVHEEDKKSAYCICGSLCTVADVLVREAELPELNVGDVLCFERCGAYSVTEAPALFLSRELPSIYTKRGDEITLVRDVIKASAINLKGL
ncbi:MAG: diaminopimelate decarboxylase [Lachnospiraceae bacterium]|nr:diaminopimelate decarboxylase [Lachnospiraceae bacterium]